MRRHPGNLQNQSPSAPPRQPSTLDTHQAAIDRPCETPQAAAAMASGAEQAGQEAQEAWCYLDGNGQAQGPFPLSYLQVLNQQGYFAAPDVLFWQEGQDGWKPLKELPQLRARLAQPPPEGAAAPPAADQQQQQAGASGGGPPAAPPGRRGAQAAAAAAVPADPALAGFLSEISELEAAAEGGEGAAAGGAAEDGDRAETPPPEEQRFEDDDGTVYVWDARLRKFMPEGEAAALAGAAGAAGAAGGAAAPASYNEEDMVFVPDEEEIPEYQPPPKYGDLPDLEDEEELLGKALAGADPAAPAGQQQPGGGRGGGGRGGGRGGRGGRGGNGKAAAGGAGGKPSAEQQEAAMEAARERSKKRKESSAGQQGWFDLKVNTSVYVTGLPDDVTEAELVETFSKCGVIKTDVEGRPRIKIYRGRESGRPKGDGLVTYLKEPSVDLAVQIMDGTALRYGLAPMSVAPAKFEQKGDAFVAQQRPSSNKRAAKKKLEKLEKQALGWGGFDDALKPQQVTVILRNMFHPDEFLANPLYKEELEEDIRGECAKLGRVDKLRVFHGHPEGAVSVKFGTQEAADECVRLMNGRFFGGRQLVAAKWDGWTNFNVKMQETEEEQQARLERYAAELEAGGAAGAEPGEQ